MLALSKKTDYALIGLAYLADRTGRVVSAREIAAAYGLPLALLMQILKVLHQHDIVQSTRGAKGGYRLTADLERLSLHDLIRVLEADRPADEAAVLEESPEARRPTRAVLRALHAKLAQFLRDVKVSDLVVPGRRIDVPREQVRVIERTHKVLEPQPVGTPA